jgi:Amt family ammonium transporter
MCLALATPACAQSSTISPADTAWMIVATALVLMMTIPGLALFYSGMVRKKNVLATMAQSLAAVAMISILWVAFGYSLAFVGDGPWLGSLDRWFLAGMTMDSTNPAAKTIPEALFMLYQMTFAIITVALVAGAVADRMRFSAYLLFSVGWFMFVYVPLAHWIWGGGFLATMGVLDFAGGLVVHLSAGVGGLVAAKVMGRRHGYGSENLSPFDLSLAVVGTGLLWVGWFGFNGGSALGANSRAVMAIIATHLAACAGALSWGVCDRGDWRDLGPDRRQPAAIADPALRRGGDPGLVDRRNLRPAQTGWCLRAFARIPRTRAGRPRHYATRRSVAVNALSIGIKLPFACPRHKHEYVGSLSCLYFRHA